MVWPHSSKHGRAQDYRPSSREATLQEYSGKLFRKWKLGEVERFLGSCMAGLCQSGDLISLALALVKVHTCELQAGEDFEG